MMSVLLRATASLLTLLAPRAHAAIDVNVIIGNIAGMLPDASFFTGNSADPGATAIDLAGLLILQTRPYLFYGAGAMLIYAGYNMVIGQDDNAKEKAKHTLTLALAGLILSFLMGPILLAFYGLEGEVIIGGYAAGLAVLCTTGGTLINWTLGLAGIVAMISIIATGLEALASAASEEGVSKMRKSIFAVIAGILLIVLKVAIASIFAPVGIGGCIWSSAPLLAMVIVIMKDILGLAGLLAVGVVIYAGLLYLTSFGNDQQAEKGKALLIRSLIGVVVVITSFFIVQIVFQGIGA